MLIKTARWGKSKMQTVLDFLINLACLLVVYFGMGRILKPYVKTNSLCIASLEMAIVVLAWGLCAKTFAINFVLLGPNLYVNSSDMMNISSKWSGLLFILFAIFLFINILNPKSRKTFFKTNQNINQRSSL